MQGIQYVVCRQPQQQRPPRRLLPSRCRVERRGHAVALGDHVDHVVDGQLVHHNMAVLLELLDDGLLRLVRLAQPASMQLIFHPVTTIPLQLRGFSL